MAKFGHQQKSNNQTLVLYGRHPVCAAIANNNRHIFNIFITQDNVDEIKKLCSKVNRGESLIKVVNRNELEKMLPHDAVHKGFVCQVKELEQYDITDICVLAEDKEKCHILILDQVTDPQNIGAIIRSCVAFDTLAMVVQDKNSPS